MHTSISDCELSVILVGSVINWLSPYIYLRCWLDSLSYGQMYEAINYNLSHLTDIIRYFQRRFFQPAVQKN